MVPPEAMVSIVFFGATLLAIGQLWFAWTCTPNVHWIVPIIAGVPFGMGNACVFIYASNYIARSYGIYAASALAGNMFTRSVMGAFLPLAGPSMYQALGLNLGSTILGIVEAVCILIPVVFYFYGHIIRKKSPFIKQMERMQGAA
jgi:predicted membrane protein